MFKTLSITLLAALLAACATNPPAGPEEQYRVSVSGLRAPERTRGGSYFLVSALKNTPESDLQFKEYSRYLDRALKGQGYYKVEDASKADLVIFLAYGIGDPQAVQYSYAVPVFGQTGVSAAQTNGVATSFGGFKSFSSWTTYTPSYGVTGYVPMTGTRFVYFRYARVDCYDYAAFRKDRREHPLWRTDIKSSGSSGDLRRVLPVMIAAARPYFGENTAQEVPVDIGENDYSVIEIRSPEAQPAVASENESAGEPPMQPAKIAEVVKGAPVGTHLRIVSISNAILNGKVREFSNGTLIIDEDQGGGLSLDLADIKSVAVAR